jgi:hypothetical protein
MALVDIAVGSDFEIVLARGCIDQRPCSECAVIILMHFFDVAAPLPASPPLHSQHRRRSSLLQDEIVSAYLELSSWFLPALRLVIKVTIAGLRLTDT